MKTAAILFVPIALTLSLASASSAAPPASARGVSMVRIGETVRVQGLRITPLRVLEDSRCPQNARCVWAGRVRISVRIGRTTRELTLGQSVPMAGGQLSLAAVLPERTTTVGTIPLRNYRFGFQYQRSQAFELISDQK